MSKPKQADNIEGNSEAEGTQAPQALPTSEAKEKNKRPTCFVAMPIADMDGYEIGHFNRVYNGIIIPACEQAGFEPSRADDVKHSDMIIITVLNRLLAAEVVIADLSGRNPNVLYELGIRQAFNLPTVLIKDKKTPRIFDISGIRDIEYDSTLRYDQVKQATRELTESIKITHQKCRDKEEVNNSVISLLGINPAPLPEKKEISGDTELLLRELKVLRQEITDVKASITLEGSESFPFSVGDTIWHEDYGTGRIVNIDVPEGLAKVQFSTGRIHHVALSSLEPEVKHILF